MLLLRPGKEVLRAEKLLSKIVEFWRWAGKSRPESTGMLRGIWDPVSTAHCLILGY